MCIRDETTLIHSLCDFDPDFHLPMDQMSDLDISIKWRELGILQIPVEEGEPLPN